MLEVYLSRSPVHAVLKTRTESDTPIGSCSFFGDLIPVESRVYLVLIEVCSVIRRRKLRPQRLFVPRW